MSRTKNGANGGDERDPKGRFLPGNSGGPGNPHALKTARLRAAMMRAVSPGDLVAVVKTLVQLAKGGDVAAAKLLLDRVLGPLTVDADTGFCVGAAVRIETVTHDDWYGNVDRIAPAEGTPE